MKIAITVKNDAPDSALERRFGRAPFFAVCDMDKPEQIEFLPNAGPMEAHGAGVLAAQILIDHNVDAIVCAKFGPNGSQALQQAGIACYLFGDQKTIFEIIESLKINSLLPHTT